MDELKIDKRKVMTIKKTIGDETYKQYLLTIPKNFAEQHQLDTVYCVANSIWIGVPDQKTIHPYQKHIPEIERLLQKKKKKL